MKSFKLGTLVVVLAALGASALSACSAHSGGSQQEAAGTLSLKLSGTSSSGATYRLRNATFAVTGPKTASLSSETNVDATSIKQELPAGNYLINLKTGWSLEKDSGGGMFAPVKAVLTSQNPAGFNIADQGTTPVVFQFKAGDDVVQLGDGTLSVQISVVDGCGMGQASCGGTCVDVTTDPFNCGACGAFCPGNSGSMIGQCVAGQCVQQCFLPGQTQCGGVCVDVTSDPLNCGACGAVCPGNSGSMIGQCVAGACVTTQCPTGQAQCGGACVDVSSDPQNCGACGLLCPAGASCQAGVCTSSMVPAVTFSQSFTSGEVSDLQCQAFNMFQGSLGSGPYNSIVLSSEFGSQSCVGPEAQQLCQALRTSTQISLTCAGTTWAVDTNCGNDVTLTADGTVCSCPVSGASLRPCIANANWGGVGTPTCGGPSQTISVTCSP